MKPLASLVTLACASSLFATLQLHAQETADPTWAAARRQVTRTESRAGQPAQEQLDQAQKAVDLALHTAGEAVAGVGDRLSLLVGQQGGSSPVIIRYSELDPKAQADLEEDLAVMGRVLDKAVAEVQGEREYKPMGIDPLFVLHSSPTRGWYLEGCGALFLANVGVPLVAPAAKSAEAEKEPGDSAWEQARQELYGAPSESKLPRGYQPYSEANVKKLKEAVLEALKSATHIRELKSHDTITVCLFGGQHAQVSYKPSESTSTDGRRRTVRVAHGTAKGTVMTLRVTKSDVDAFAKGDLTLEAFTRKARILAYTGNAAPAGFGMGGYTTQFRSVPHP